MLPCASPASSHRGVAPHSGQAGHDRGGEQSGLDNTPPPRRLANRVTAQLSHFARPKIADESRPPCWGRHEAPRESRIERPLAGDDTSAVIASRRATTQEKGQFLWPSCDGLEKEASARSKCTRRHARGPSKRCDRCSARRY